MSDDGDLFLDSLEVLAAPHRTKHVRSKDKPQHNTQVSESVAQAGRPENRARSRRDSFSIPEVLKRPVLLRDQSVASRRSATSHSRQLSLSGRSAWASASTTNLPNISKDKIKSVWNGLSSKALVSGSPKKHPHPKQHTSSSQTTSVGASGRTSSLTNGVMKLREQTHARTHRQPSHGSIKAASILQTSDRRLGDQVVATSEVVHGELVHVNGCSFETLQALTFYLATRHVELLPRGGATRSENKTNKDGKVSAEQSEATHVFPPEASNDNPTSPFKVAIPAMPATSAYALATQLGLLELQGRSISHISSTLRPDTVLEELLSPLGERFSLVRDAMLKYVGANWETVRKSPNTSRTLERLARGEFPAASASLLQLWNLFNVAS